MALLPEHNVISFRYLVAEDEKQSSFTGAQHRKAVHIIPNAVSDVFGLEEDLPTPPDPAVLSKGRARGRRRGGGAESGDAATNNASADSLFNVGDGDEEELPADFLFGWDAYYEAFGDKPLEDAITTMFAEYGALYARIAGGETSSAPEPMKLEVEEALSKDAADFVVGFVKPLLTEVHTSNINKLLRHRLDAIRLSLNLRNGPASSKEAGHKVDKAYNDRTNRVIKTRA